MHKMELRKLQLLQLEAFKTVDRICREYGIKYYMIGGTLIGAVRYKGFIPWDDDIDIAMMRSEYDRFLRICPAELPDKYFVQNYHTDVDVISAHTRICILGTWLDDKYCRHLKFHKEAYIDIFPLDNMPDDAQVLDKFKKRINILDSLMFYKACIVYKNGLFFSKLIIKKILQVLLSPVPLKVLQRWREQAVVKYAGQHTVMVCNTISKYGFQLKEVMRRSVFGDPVLLEFEGGMYFAPQEWDTYLQRIYGDYRTPRRDGPRSLRWEVYEL